MKGENKMINELKSATEWFEGLNIAEKMEVLEMYYPDDMYYRGDIDDLWKYLAPNLKIEAYKENHEIFEGER